MDDFHVLDLLKFYIDAGVDITVDSGIGLGDCDVSDGSVDTESEVQVASRVACAVTNIGELRKAVEDFNGCSQLRKFATNTVFARGNPAAKVMLIGEAPGATEDERGIPFCGKSGELLDKMFATIGLMEDDLYITNTVFWRPPGNRTPTEQEIMVCRPFVERHIALIDPCILVCVGSTACKSVLESGEVISRLRGRMYDKYNVYLKRTVKTTVIFHPSYLLRQASQKKLAWLDLQMIRNYLQNLNVEYTGSREK